MSNFSFLAVAEHNIICSWLLMGISIVPSFSYSIYWYSLYSCITISV